ncbi:hypothetical protein KJ564_07230, partial [bacterium]|nr:hypothetical protein [bacterium]
MPKTFFSALIICLVVGLSTAGMIHIPGDHATIQEGINAASNGDTVLVADGDWSGTGNKNLDFAGRSIVVMSENGPETCTINCLNSGQGFYFHTNETTDAVVEGFTITGGNSAYGGGIRIDNASPSIKHCIIRNNNGSY